MNVGVPDVEEDTSPDRLAKEEEKEEDIVVTATDELDWVEDTTGTELEWYVSVAGLEE